VPSSLSAVPIGARRRLAVTLALFAGLLTVIGAVAATGGGTAAAAFSAFALTVAVLLALVSWGTRRSVRLDLADARLDDVIADALGRTGLSCGCGHQHDPDDLHVTDAGGGQADPCAHDGTGAACTHDCETCVLAAKRPSYPHNRP
jgi:hypothetical protein